MARREAARLPAAPVGTASVHVRLSKLPDEENLSRDGMLADWGGSAPPQDRYPVQGSSSDASAAPAGMSALLNALHPG
jgi:hypothetical protein